jgi:hypothetical protein
VSQRSRREGGARGKPAENRPARGSERGPGTGGGGAPGRPPNRISFAGQVGILVAVFAIAVGIAELFGASNLGVAFGIGQICFAIVLVALLLRA